MILCGAAREIINPEKGHLIAGYGPDYPNEGVHDDISLTCLYFSQNKSEAVLISYDLIMFSKEFTNKIRQNIAEAIEIAAEHVYLTNTHVHSGPIVCPMSDKIKSLTASYVEPYQQDLIEKSIRAAKKAKENKEECDLLYNYAFVKENMNRRFFLPDRTHLFIPLYKQLTGQSTEYCDHELGIIAFKKKGKPNKYKALITNFTAHPLCVGNSSNLITADYQGVLRATVEKTLTGALVCSTTGAAGDLHPLRPESGFAEAKRMGEVLGTTVVQRLYDAITCEEAELRLAYPEISLRKKDSEGKIQTAVSLLGIGPLLLTGMPGEVASVLGAHLKYSCAFLKTYALNLATDCLSYLSARNQFYWGGYEPGVSLVHPGEAEKVIYHILAEAEKLLAERPMKLNNIPEWDGRH